MKFPGQVRKTDNPITAMTANAFKGNRQAAFAAGMNAHLAKLFRTEKRY